MKNIDTAAIRARCEAATPGQWIHRPEKSFDVQSDNKNIASCFRSDNAEFISHARTDLPALLDAYEVLEAENARLADIIKDYAERQNPQPLTLEQLWEMDGMPVFCKGEDNAGLNGFGIVDCEDEKIVDAKGDYWTFEAYIDKYVAYAHQPKGAKE